MFKPFTIKGYNETSMPHENSTIAHVDYATLDRAKQAFIAASRRTLRFAKKFGFVPNETLGASANIFELDLGKFLKKGQQKLHITLLTEGLGTADDARPDDLTPKELTEFWFNIGIKTVSVMTNDAAAAGLQPILISLYLPSSQPEVVFSKAFLKGFLDGFVEGCRRVGCVYISGETPQLRTKIYPGKLDIAGAVFALSKTGTSQLKTAKFGAGNQMVFIESSGPNENGFTTLRHLAEQLPKGYRTKLPSGKEYWQAINAASHLYAPLVQELLSCGVSITNIEPITGHGWQKLMRSSEPLKYIIENMLPVPEVFTFVQQHAKLSPKEMIEIFNYGVGYAIFTDSQTDAEAIVRVAKKHRLRACIAGNVVKSSKREVEVKPLNVHLSAEHFLLKKC